MSYLLNLLIFLISALLVNCQSYECPSYGIKNGKKVPDILKLVENQNGYFSTVEVNNKDRENLVHEYFNNDRKLGYVDLEAMKQTGVNRRYYYHETGEKVAVFPTRCATMDLDMTEKVESIKDWFEPKDIVETSEIFKDFVHFGPSVLMIYANSISDKASFLGSESIEGRSIDHWFYCIANEGPYIDFYFDAETSYPYRFSLFYPDLELNEEGNDTIQTEEGRHSDYVYNFFNYKPLVITSADPIPQPLGWGCSRKNAIQKWALPDIGAIDKFTMSMEAVMIYSTGEIIKTTARVMKYGEVYSYEITEDGKTVRSIENPPPLGRWEVDEFTGKCEYKTSDYGYDITLVTRWPFFTDRGFNLLYYIVMKPSPSASPSYISTIDMGTVSVEEYRASSFFVNTVDAIVDYYYPVSNSTSTYPDDVPSKIVFTKDITSSNSKVPDSVEVTIFDFREGYYDVEDRFDVSGCYEDFGSYTWFQIVFSNPWTYTTTDYAIREQVHDFLTEFIPITRISDTVIDTINSNIYVTVKLLDRIHFIEAYQANKGYMITNAGKIVKQWRIEDCETACTSSPECTEFSYCSDFTCSILTDNYMLEPISEYNVNCSIYSVESHNQAAEYVSKNFLSTMRHVINQIRRKIDQDLLYIDAIASSAEELFIVHGPEEIGDLSENDYGDYETGAHFFRGDEYPLIQTDRRFVSGIATETKVEYTECLKLCSNDDDCNTVSYCPNQNKECILSTETNLTLQSTLAEATKTADECSIYEKSFMSYFQQYPGKSLVVDAAATKEGVHVTDCAKECINSKDFTCESFDYCSARSQSDTVCFLHIHHITADTTNEVNASNWKYAENGCDHYSKKSDHDYREIVAHQFSTTTEVISTHKELPLTDCADKCNSDREGCYTFEYCETVAQIEVDDWFGWTGSSETETTCRLSNVKPKTTSNTNDPEFTKYFTKYSADEKICSVYINQEKILKSSSTKTPNDKLNLSTGQKDRTNLAYGLGSFFLIVAFATGLAGFTFAVKRSLISI